MAAGLEILAPINITRVVRASQDRFNLPQPLLWYERAAKPNVTDDELTLKYDSAIYAADIIAWDAEALIRDTGAMTLERYEKAKLKHGHSINETMLKTLRRISNGMAMDNEVLSWENWVATRAAWLRLGIEQRYECLLNGLFADTYAYNRLGIKATGTFGMRSDLKFVAGTAHTTAGSATPLLDVVTALNYAADTYNEQYGRITGEYSWIAAVVATTEFKNIFKVAQATNNLQLPTEQLTINAATPLNQLGFLSAYFSAQLGWEVTVEVSRGQYFEFSPSTVGRGTPEKFHAHGLLYFTNPGDDGASSGWDLAKGEVMEALVGSMGGIQIMGSFADWGSSFHGPVAYATPVNPHGNPPGMAIWAADEGAPRKLRDTATARFKWN